ncbi:SpoIIE family protein phosphatase [Streptomyces filamentosus]|uniref:SpoIIE family protein phosphatase n=1 Tax=Streptomyces filamentosus TaxID=67294 RepID=UPI00123C70D2|nr:SpoIIE family protein phosphatase [Streptomyces filamentosus]KAA6210793.1 ANTAR domain-containing protein [Streptomyces filamentosus]
MTTPPPAESGVAHPGDGVPAVPDAADASAVPDTPAVPKTPAVPDAPDASAAEGRLAATVERLRGEVRAAHAAAEGRALIELAKGVIVERLGCGPTQAARQLAELADRAGLSRLELAADIINQAARDRMAEATDEFVRTAVGEPPATGASTGASVAVRLRTAESAALSAGDTQAVAESLLRHALEPLGAVAVAIWTTGPDTSLSLRGHAGFGLDEAARWHHVPPGVTTAARQALVGRRTVRYASLSAAGIPSIGRGPHPDGGRVVVPAGTGGRIHGVLEICWPGPLGPLPQAVERQIEALAELCAHTLETLPGESPGSLPVPGGDGATTLAELSDGLYDPALVLTPHLDETGALVDFRIRHANAHFQDPAGRPRGSVDGALLLEAYPATAGSSELFERIERVYATGEPFRARRVRLTALVDQVPLASLADISISRHGASVLFIWRVEDESARLASLLQHAQRLGRVGAFEEDLLTGDITWHGQLYELFGRSTTEPPVALRDLAGLAHPDDADTIRRFLQKVLEQRRVGSTAFRMLRHDGVTRHIRVTAEPAPGSDGGLQAVRGAYQDISAQHWTEVALTATRDRLAATEEAAEERNRLTLQLQHAIMPPAMPPLDAPGLDVAVRYRPAESDSLVGGDWYDAVVLPSKKVLLCVGDVAGHGVEAATGMVVLRNALRGLAVTGAGPGQLLSWLNGVAHHLTAHVTATAVCGVYDPESRTLRWARAGHLPPVLVRGEEALDLPLLRGVLLGALAEAEYEETELRLEPGDTVLMYTDGLVERRDTAVHDSVAQLLTVARQPSDSLEHRLDQLLARSKSDTDDDTCVVGVQVL